MAIHMVTMEVIMISAMVAGMVTNHPGMEDEATATNPEWKF